MNYDKQINDTIAETLAKVGEANGREFADIRWEWARFTSKMGSASTHRRLIRFAAPLWSHATEEQRRQTVVHEVCHILSDQIAGRRTIHGPAWRRTMVQAGYPNPQRCHSVAPLNRELLVCECGNEIYLTKLIAQRVRSGQHRYKCRQCKRRLTMTSEREAANEAVPVHRHPLVGRTIVEVRKMTATELDAEGWDDGPEGWRTGDVIALVLDDGQVVYPSKDGEGNGGGALFGRDGKSTIAYPPPAKPETLAIVYASKTAGETAAPNLDRMSLPDLRAVAKRRGLRVSKAGRYFSRPQMLDLLR